METQELFVTPLLCTCPTPGYCERYKRTMSQRRWEICQGINIDSDLAGKYRTSWEEKARNGQTEDQNAECPYLGAPVMDGEKQKTRPCPACTGIVELKLHHCTHPAREPDQVTVKEDCWGSCPYKPRTTYALDLVVKKTVLLRFPHGLGDCVSFLIVLAHLAKHRPGWQIDVACDPSCRTLFQGRCRETVTLDTDASYDWTYDIKWEEGTGNYPEWPSTKAVRCLVEVFHITPERELLRPTYDPGDEARKKAADFLESLPRKKGVVAIHYEGNNCKDSKDLDVEDVSKLCDFLLRKEFVPLLIDNSAEPKLADGTSIFATGKLTVDVLAAILGKTVLNVLIDSGPQKLALTTDVSLLAVWRHSSPLHYIDCPDSGLPMVQLVPSGWEETLERSNGVNRHCDRKLGSAFFLGHYRWHTYEIMGQGLCDMAAWLLADTTAGPVSPDQEKALSAQKETPQTTTTLVTPVPGPRRLLLATGLPPGDVMTLTAAVEMLHQQYPDKYLTAVATNYPAIWEHNRWIVPADTTFERIEMHYHNINESGNRPTHFIEGYTEFLAHSLRVPIRMNTNRPHLYISSREKTWINQVWEATGSDAPYWIVNAGVKRDYTAKQYPFYQEVIDLLRGKVRFAQVGLESDLHPPLKGVISLVGKTSDRALIRLAYWTQGVLCGTTWLMHLAAAFEKPAVIVAGGREPRPWNAYPNQTLLSTVGAPWAPENGCCRTGACWKSRVAPQNDGKDGELCKRPMPTNPPAGECMTRLSPELVASAILAMIP